MPKGSWLISMRFLKLYMRLINQNYSSSLLSYYRFNKIFLNSGRMRSKSVDIINGAAIIAHNAICDWLWSIESPKFPINSISGSFQCPGPAFGWIRDWLPAK